MTHDAEPARPPQADRPSEAGGTPDVRHLLDQALESLDAALSALPDDIDACLDDLHAARALVLVARTATPAS